MFFACQALLTLLVVYVACSNAFTMSKVSGTASKYTDDIKLKFA